MTIRASPKSNAKILASPRIYGEKILSELLDPDRRQRLLSLGQATYQASDGGDATAGDHEDRLERLSIGFCGMFEFLFRTLSYHAAKTQMTR